MVYLEIFISPMSLVVTSAWANFISSLAEIVDDATYNRIVAWNKFVDDNLAEYNCILTIDNILCFDTEDDRTLFLLRWS